MKKNKIIKSSLARRNLEKFLSNKLAVIGLVIFLVLILASIAAPLLTKYDPSFVDPSLRYLPVSSSHFLGTDSVGRDLFTRILYGGRISIFIGIGSALGASFIGIILGCISGYFGSKTDNTILYISEIFMTFPSMILILILIGFLGQGVINLLVIFSFTSWTGTYRLVRGRILSLREEPFVECCQANGIGKISIMFNHLLPNTLGPVIVDVTLMSAGFVLAEAGLSFIGLGVSSGVPTWGNIINSAKSFAIFQNYPLIWVAPGVIISLFILSVNFLGDGLRDVFDTKQ